MTQTFKTAFALIALLVVSACGQANSQSQVFSDYDYYSGDSADYAYAPSGGQAFYMNNQY